MEKSIHSGNKPNISHVLAIDFGKSKIGLAMADMETKIAFVYEIIKNDKDLSNKLAEIIAEEGVGKIIIGIPAYKLSSNCHPVRQLADSESPEIRSRNLPAGRQGKFGMTDCSKYEKLGNEIVKKTGIEVEYQNEMFTTKMAQENIKERGDKNVAQKDDAEAAKIMLQDWLDKT